MSTGSRPAAPALGLPRSCRFRLGADFARLKAQGRRLVSGCVILNLLPLGPGAPQRLGVVVSRRVGNAVARSRARRLLREVWRRNQHSFIRPLELVMIARPSIAGKTMRQVENDFRAALDRAGLWKRK